MYAGEKKEGAKNYQLRVVQWERRIHCAYLNDFRIAGGKPWGGGATVATWDVTMSDLEGAVPAIRRMRVALEKIAAGDGAYGAQAHEYKALARAALQSSGASNG